MLGEHAVVYGHPALAIPVHQVQAKVTASADIGVPRGRIRILSPKIHIDTERGLLADDHPLSLAIDGALRAVGVEQPPALLLRIDSTLPVAAGLGSGAAVSVALIRALTAFLGYPLPDAEVNALAYTVEQRLHGTPSGIDNTVITYARPIFYQREHGFQPLTVGAPLTFVIGDTGVRSPTREAVAAVRQDWQAEPARSEALFAHIARIVIEGRAALEGGRPQTLGSLMNEDQRCLAALNVSSPELERLVGTALDAGALGAKLSGGGRGGNMIALVTPERAKAIASALQAAGAVRVLTTRLLAEPAREVQHD